MRASRRRSGGELAACCGSDVWPGGTDQEAFCDHHGMTTSLWKVG
jgi:hypothetical protein